MIRRNVHGENPGLEWLSPGGAIDPVKLDTIGRMGGDLYTRTTELFSIKRPG